jgi:TonB family protein
MKKVVLSLFALASLIPVAASAQQQPLRVGGNVKAPERVRYVQPEYPEVAKGARVSGIVIAEIVVSPDGDVSEAHVIRSIALLDDAAIDAIRQWKYTPTTLNGVPVPVIMTVTVNFSLSDNPPPPPQMQTVASFSPSPSDPLLVNGRPVVRIGGDVKAPERIKFVAPRYPEEAQAARVSGIVIVEAVIDETGHVANAKIVRSVALLDQAALDAVMQWEFTPTLLNGVATPVLMTMTVNFTLSK